jgi:copper resistance protein C
VHTWNPAGVDARLAEAPRTPRHPRRPWLLGLLAVLLSLPLAVLAAGPASAHTKLVSSNPANAAALVGPPTQIVLTFNEEPKSVTSVRAQSTDGPLVALGEPVLDGKTVTVSWPQDQAPGLFRLVYVLVSDDGDPVEGPLLFSYAAAPASSPAPAASTAASTAASSAAVPAPVVSSSGVVSSGVSNAAPAVTQPESATGRAWIVGVALVALAALTLLWRTRRHTPAVDLRTEAGTSAPLPDREPTEV